MPPPNDPGAPPPPAGPASPEMTPEEEQALADAVEDVAALDDPETDADEEPGINPWRSMSMMWRGFPMQTVQ